VKPKVYIETSVISYYVGRASRDVVIAGRQQSTQEFWPMLSGELSPYVSALVAKEVDKGVSELARKRQDAIASFPVLRTTPQAEQLAWRQGHGSVSVVQRPQLG
jgi:hypothetical protein